MMEEYTHASTEADARDLCAFYGHEYCGGVDVGPDALLTECTCWCHKTHERMI